MASLLLALSARAAEPDGQPTFGPGRDGFIGAETCGTCHQAAYRDWQASNHRHAMERATDATVAAPFAGETVRYHGRETRFLRGPSGFLVRTDGPDGAIADFPVTHVFGHAPLRQYLVPFPGGRLQPLPWAWDARPAPEGGQRWFHLYPQDDVTHRDPLHWTGRIQNWNRQCAACHVTGLIKGYDAATDSYRTTAAAMGVTCEACHGPGAGHAAWAADPAAGPAVDKGLQVVLTAPPGGAWTMDPARGIARWEGPARPAALTETCAPCHARSRPVSGDGRSRLPFLDAHAPALLDAGLYEPDGMIQGEVFEWGSFVQSRMHRAGVVCSDCHQPHSGRLRVAGSGVCLQCHAAERFESVTHHHHADGGAGAQCSACHMPNRTYMGIHVRHDHGFRIPRPDLSLRLGTPNACTDCHRDRDAAWADGQVASWFPDATRRRRDQGDDWAIAIAAGRRGSADAARRLSAVVANPSLPAIVRASAWGLLPAERATTALVARGARDPDPLVRMGLADAAAGLASGDRIALLAPLLDDPLRAVRIAAARGLAAVPDAALPDPARLARRRAMADYVAATRQDTDDPQALATLGQTWVDQGRPADAERAFADALRLQPSHQQAILGLVEAWRRAGRERDAEQRLRAALSADPGSAILHFALGLSLARQQRLTEAEAALTKAEELAPGNPNYTYVHAVAQNSLGQPQRAYETLRAGLSRNPDHRGCLLLMALIARDMGAITKARDHVGRILALDPGDETARRLMDGLRQR